MRYLANLVASINEQIDQLFRGQKFASGKFHYVGIGNALVIGGPTPRLSAIRELSGRRIREVRGPTMRVELFLEKLQILFAVRLMA